MTIRLRRCIHEMANHLTAVSGYLELGDLKKARAELKKVIACLNDLRDLLKHESK